MAERTELHRRNRHNGSYNFDQLVSTYPPLGKFVAPNKFGTISIDFFNPSAVKALNKALLMSHYEIEYWDIPANHLCPPIPSRADYIHYVAELVPGRKVRCLDLGVGANCIYPIIGSYEYGWQFVGTEISSVSLANAAEIVEKNQRLKGHVELRLQPNPQHCFEGVVSKDDYFDLAICNPPFHGSQTEAQSVSLRKLSNLKGKKVSKALLNFGGTDNELWCEGGELGFILNMISESRDYARNVGWFTVLVSKEENLGRIYSKLHEVDIEEYQTIKMQQGNKMSRIVVWRFF